MSDSVKFKAEIAHHLLGRYRYRVVYLPARFVGVVIAQKRPKVRIEGELNGYGLSGAWQLSRGRWFLMLSKSLLKDAQVDVGDVVEVEFRVTDQSEVTAPLELLERIQASTALTRTWERLSPGMRRALSHRVFAAKTPVTRARRVQEIAILLRKYPILDTRTLREQLTRRR